MVMDLDEVEDEFDGVHVGLVNDTIREFRRTAPNKVWWRFFTRLLHTAVCEGGKLWSAI
jgi:hypothetical protein